MGTPETVIITTALAVQNNLEIYTITLHFLGEPRMDGLWPCAEYVQ